MFLQTLEVNTEGELHQARLRTRTIAWVLARSAAAVDNAGGFNARGRAAAAVRIAGADVIEGIICIHAELEHDALLDGEVLDQRQVSVKEVGPQRRVAANVADGIETRTAEAAVGALAVAEVVTGGNDALEVGPLVREGLERAEAVLQEGRTAIRIDGGRSAAHR